MTMKNQDIIDLIISHEDDVIDAIGWAYASAQATRDREYSVYIDVDGVVCVDEWPACSNDTGSHLGGWAHRICTLRYADVATIDPADAHDYCTACIEWALEELERTDGR